MSIRAVKNETGKQYGRLTVIERAGSKAGKAAWLCHCECGNDKVITGECLRKGVTKSCGCLHLPDETGKRYGKLTVIERKGSSKSKEALWLCHCDCGNEKLVTGAHLRQGQVKSCGCWYQYPQRKGGKAARNLYALHKVRAKRRRVEFTLTFEAFILLVLQNCHYCGLAPSNHTTRKWDTLQYSGLDRVDNTKGYTPDNVVPCCRTCNFAKCEMPQTEFLGWIRQVYEHNNMGTASDVATVRTE